MLLWPIAAIDADSNDTSGNDFKLLTTVAAYTVQWQADASILRPYLDIHLQ